MLACTSLTAFLTRARLSELPFFDAGASTKRPVAALRPSTFAPLAGRLSDACDGLLLICPMCAISRKLQAGAPRRSAAQAYPRTVANQIMWIGPLPFSRARTRTASTSNPALNPRASVALTLEQPADHHLLIVDIRDGLRVKAKRVAQQRKLVDKPVIE